MAFEPKRLLTYDDGALIAEIQRVAALIPDEVITVGGFNRIARVDVTTLRNRFGGWLEALRAAGLEHRYNDTNRQRSREEVIAELQRVAALLGRSNVARREFDAHGRFGQRAVTTAFDGSWSAALDAAGLKPNYIRDPSVEQCFENLLTVWTHQGRAPNYREMKLPPSRITGKAYARKWGTWTKAIYAFVEYAAETEMPSEDRREERAESVASTPDQGPRLASVRLRYQVLVRDGFRCVLCGASPATTLGCELHVDHIVPYSKGGRTVFENLRALCSACNLGKRADLP